MPTKIPALLPVSQITLSGRSGEGYSALRGWRPIPAALHTPIRRSLFRGGRPSLSPTGQNFPDEAVSIGKTTGYVKRKSKVEVCRLPSSFSRLQYRSPSRSCSHWPGTQLPIRFRLTPKLTSAANRSKGSVVPNGTYPRRVALCRARGSRSKGTWSGGSRLK